MLTAEDSPNEASNSGSLTPPNAVPDEVIDPLLLLASQEQASSFNAFVPKTVEGGGRVPENAYAEYLESFTRRQPLCDACDHFQIRYPKRATLERLRDALVRYWYHNSATKPSRDSAGLGSALKTPQPCVSASTPTTAKSTPGLSHTPLSTSQPPRTSELDVDIDIDDDALAKEYAPPGTADEDGTSLAERVFGALDSGGLEDEDQDEDDELNLKNDDDFLRYQTNVCVSAAKRSEANRRPGGAKTQKSVVRSFDIFIEDALAKGQVRDRIVDEHCLLLLLDFCGNRCRRDRNGEYIPGTRIGASQIKKEFFGALRIRKVQDARDSTLAQRRPAATVHVYDAVKARMDEALKNAREGLIPADDAPDIVANTFLDQVTDETMTKIHCGFLEHRELKATVNGHMAWTMMNASGNRGDDIRALRLCEMQPYTMLHPNGETEIFCVLGLQSDMEHKARSKAMRTTVNPMYTCFIAHREPEMCPLGAFAIYLHYIHDVIKIDEKYKIDYTVNKSWRAVRLIHGSSAVVPYNESALYNLYCQAFSKADVSTSMKQHFARHRLGYQQQKMGVEAEETAKMGWSRDVYMNTYAPALPKKAILGAHGYKVHETYSPTWTQVQVPEAFLKLICPMAEGNIELVKDQQGKVGAYNYWEMVIKLRPYFFQAAAALFQLRPNSSLFRLPALVREEVRIWMKDVFPVQLENLRAAEGTPESLERVQNEVLRKSMEQLRHETELQRQVIRDLTQQIGSLTSKVERRTSQWTPAKAPPRAMVQATTKQLTTEDMNAVSRRLFPAAAGSSTPALQKPSEPSSPFTIASEIDPETRAAEDTGMYCAPDNTLRAFIVPSPGPETSPRPRTAVDLQLPPMIAFCEEGDDLWPRDPLFGKGSVQWPDVFNKIKRPELLWEVWKPAKSLDQMTLQAVWDCYNVGEPVLDKTGNQTGMKPPLRLVEQYFQAKWRKGDTPRKVWQRFREIPEWIDSEVNERRVTPSEVIKELEAIRHVEGKLSPLGTNALAHKVASLRKAKAKQGGNVATPSSRALSSDAESTCDSAAKKRRAPTIGGRPKPKKPKKTK